MLEAERAAVVGHADQQHFRLSWWQRRNWWKIGFYVLLVVFEFTREIAVLASDADTNPKIAVGASVSRVSTFTHATGRWTRIDGGDPMVPGATVIDCNEARGECVEATASNFNGYLSEPDVSTYPATFTPVAIVYGTSDPLCARYSTRIDLKLQKVFAVRERKEDNENETCRKLERRIEMTLGNGFQPVAKPFGNHWVPLMRLTAAVVGSL